MKLNKAISKNELFVMLRNLCEPAKAKVSCIVDNILIIEANKIYLYKENVNNKVIIIDDNLKKIELTYDEFNFLFNFDINDYDTIWSGNKQIYAKLLYEDINNNLQVPKELRDKIISDYEKYLQNKIIFENSTEDINKRLKELDEEKQKLLSQKTEKEIEFQKNNQMFEGCYYDFDDISSPF